MRKIEDVATTDLEKALLFMGACAKVKFKDESWKIVEKRGYTRYQVEAELVDRSRVTYYPLHSFPQDLLEFWLSYKLETCYAKAVKVGRYPPYLSFTAKPPEGDAYWFDYATLQTLARARERAAEEAKARDERLASATIPVRLSKPKSPFLPPNCQGGPIPDEIKGVTMTTLEKLQIILNSPVQAYHGFAIKMTIPSIYAVDGASLSVQASKSHACSPKADKGPYTSVEVWCLEDADAPDWYDLDGDPTRYVPIEKVAAFFDAHGGIAP